MYRCSEICYHHIYLKVGVYILNVCIVLDI